MPNAAAKKLRNGSRYRRIAKELRGQPCWRCGAPSTTVGHVPPIAVFPSPELWVGEHRPECGPCNFSEGGRIGSARRHARRVVDGASRAW